MKKILFFDAKKAFSLAETLIALTIIGVVAVFTVPTVVNAVNERSWNAAKDTFNAKVEEAAKQMNVAGELSDYSTNEAFVNAFQKYIKVAKRCTSSNLSDCFGPVFRDSGGEEVNTSDLVTGKNLGHETYTSNLVGLSIIDGTNVILAFNPDCPQLDWVNTSSGSTTSCLSMIYDINGKKSPNQIGKDIGALNAIVSSTDCIIIGSLCIASEDIKSYPPFGTYIYNYGEGEKTYDNYWAGAKKVCEDIKMRLPNRAELDILYNNYANGGNTLGLDAFCYWSSAEHSYNLAWLHDFRSGTQDDRSKYGKHRVRCVK